MTDKEHAQEKITFYSIHDFDRTSESFEDNKNWLFEKYKEINFPCILLVRNTGWNDYTYVSHFCATYFSSKEEGFYLGYVKIIQAEPIEQGVRYKTELPATFEQVNTKEYFSRAFPGFYETIRVKLPALEEKILHALNDVHVKGYSAKDFSETENEKLYYAYRNSLYRYDGGEFITPSEYYANSMLMLSNIRDYAKKLITEENPKEQNTFMINILFGSVITTLETYLGDAFKYNILNKEHYFLSFIRFYKYPRSEKKYTLKELGVHGKQIVTYIKEEVKNLLNEIIFHDIELVLSLYKDILNINLPNSLLSFQNSVYKRHDIFHRTGKDKNNEPLNISKDELLQLIDDVKQFIDDTEHTLEALI